MWPTQLSVYLMPQFDLTQLAKLEQFPFAEPTGLAWFNDGWVPPTSFSDQLVYPQVNRRLITLRRGDRDLSASVVREALAQKVAEIEQQELRKLGRKERLALKEQITDDLLPRAFIKYQQTAGWLDPDNGLLMIHSASATRAERFISKLRETLANPLPLPLPRTAISPASRMTDWLLAEEADAIFTLGDAALLREQADSGAQIRISRQDLSCDEVRQHIVNGKQATELSLIWREKIMFTLTADLRLKKLAFLDVLQEEASQAGDDLQTLFEASTLLASSELTLLFQDLIAAHGGLIAE